MKLIYSKDNNFNLQYFLLITIAILFIFQTQNAEAVVSIDWIYQESLLFGSADPPHFFGLEQDLSNIVNGFPISVIVDASDEENFSSNGIIDTIDVLITSNDEPEGVIYTLIETEPNTGIFTGSNFVFLREDYRFLVSDIVVVNVTTDNSSGCDEDNTITFLDNRQGSIGDGLRVISDTDLNGIGLLLTETGENTCVFSGQVKFTTDGVSDETTGTLRVSQGDILGFENNHDFTILSGQIIPTINGKGSILVHEPVDDLDETAELFATYNGLSSGTDINDGSEGGGGSGSPVGPKPGLVLNFIRALIGGGGNPSEPPTLGIDKNHKRIVEQGFSFNGNPVDAELFYTPYPLITTEVGKLNTIKLKIYEDKGPDNISHVGLSYGIGKGETFNQGRATIEFDRTFDGKESISLFDPNHVLGDVNVTTTTIDCSPKNNAQCLEVTFDHIFRESLEYNMIATNIWDFERHGWQNYFNHGIEIVGDSMNPPEVYTGIYNGKLYKLIETGKNTAIDDEGNSWTMDKIWTRDYIKPQVFDRDAFNQEKMAAVQGLGFQYSDGKEVFGFSRTDTGFSKNLNQEYLEAQEIMRSICPECQKDSFEKINNIFSYDIPPRISKLNDPEIINLLAQEDQKAREFLKKYFQQLYPDKVYD